MKDAIGKRIKTMLKYALRGSIGFGAGGLFVVFMELLLFSKHWELMPTNFIFGAYFLSGAFGAFFLLWGLEEALKGAIGFGIGFVLTSFMVLFTMLSLQASAGPEYSWGAIGCGIGFGLGGGLGGAFIRLELALAGALSFGIAGAAWGLLVFYHVWERKGALLLSLGDIAGLLVILFPYLLGGALFGAALGFLLKEA
jgi:hypothetical protein